MNSNPYIGWYSQQSADLYGTVVYRREDGTETHVTQAAQDMSGAPGWPDAVFLGEIGTYVRQGRSGSQLRRPLERSFGDLEVQPIRFDFLNDPSPIKQFIADFNKIGPIFKKNVAVEEDVTPTVIEVKDGVTTVVEGGK